MKLRRESYQRGWVTLDDRRGVWYFRWREDGIKRSERLGTVKELPTKAKARTKAAGLALTLLSAPGIGARRKGEYIPLSAIAQRYIKEILPEKKFSTRSAYRYNLDNHIIPAWGAEPIASIKAQNFDCWLKSLTLSAKTKVHLRGLMSILIDTAIYWELVPTGSNMMNLVKIRGATKRESEPTILTVGQFRSLLDHMEREPYRTMAFTAMCLGLRVSELLGLKWKDVDWQKRIIRIERGMVRNREDDVKTRYSRKPMPIEGELYQALKAWKAETEFNAEADWIWASPAMAGEKPLFYTTLLEEVRNAATKAGIEGVGWHTFRHSFRSWMGQTGAELEVQQKLMRHSDIRTTMNIYGDTVQKTLRKTHGKIVKMASRTA